MTTETISIQSKDFTKTWTYHAISCNSWEQRSTWNQPDNKVQALLSDMKGTGFKDKLGKPLGWVGNKARVPGTSQFYLRSEEGWEEGGEKGDRAYLTPPAAWTSIQKKRILKI